MTKSQQGIERFRYGPSHPSLGKISSSILYKVHWIHLKTRMGPPVPPFGRNMAVFLRSFLDSPEDADVWDSIEVTLASVGAATEGILNSSI